MRYSRLITDVLQREDLCGEEVGILEEIRRIALRDESGSPESRPQNPCLDWEEELSHFEFLIGPGGTEPYSYN